MRSDTFGCVRMLSDAFGNFGKILEVFGKNRYYFDDSERFRRFLELFGRVRTHLDAFGCIRKFLEASGKFRFFSFIFLKFSEIFRRVRIKNSALYDFCNV